MNDSLTLSLPNRLSELPRVAAAVGQFLQAKGLAAEVIDVVHLALDELLTNTIRWGYADHDEHQVQVQVAVDAAQVRLVIEDDGHPFDPTSAPPPDLVSPLEDRREGGLGIHLIRAMAEEITYQRLESRNRVQVSVARNAPASQ